MKVSVWLLVFSLAATCCGDDRRQYVMDGHDVRACQFDTSIVVLIPVCPKPSRYSGKSGGEPEDPDFLMLCNVDTQTGRVSTHRVPWDLRLSIYGDNPEVAFLHHSGTFYAIVKGHSYSDLFGKRPSRSPTDSYVLSYMALSGFRWVDSAEEQKQLIAIHDCGQAKKQLLKLPRWIRSDDTLDSSLQITEKLSLNHEHGPEGATITLQLNYHHASAIEIVP